ncbi:SsrA-binding protein [Christensenellaceae bacterium OttesenSCG-928-L17]|nr:SsrA-binding protein [Christensenellaceae bacterium OttesenSCG-928-L17]
MAKKHTDKVVNRRAHYDYHLGNKLEVGMVLSGPEVRAIRDSHAQLKGTYITIRRGELYLLNLTLGSDNIPEIKLLATRRQIKALLEAKQQGNTIVPVELLPKKRYIKLIIATATGKKTYDKRETIKKRDLERESFR